MTGTKPLQAWQIVCAALAAGLAGCGGESSGPGDGGVDPEIMADALHAIMEADRTVYSQQGRQPPAGRGTGDRRLRTLAG